MALSDNELNPYRLVGEEITGDPLGTPRLFYRYTGQLFTGAPKKTIFSDPIRYYDAEGMELVPEGRLNPKEFLDVETWENYTIPLEDVKNYLKVDHELENGLIARFTGAAIQKAAQRINRTFDKVPPDVELAIFQTISYWYENRSDMNTIPADAAETFDRYYRWPGL